MNKFKNKIRFMVGKVAWTAMYNIGKTWPQKAKPEQQYTDCWVHFFLEEEDMFHALFRLRVRNGKKQVLDPKQRRVGGDVLEKFKNAMGNGKPVATKTKTSSKEETKKTQPTKARVVNIK